MFRSTLFMFGWLNPNQGGLFGQSIEWGEGQKVPTGFWCFLIAYCISSIKDPRFFFFKWEFRWGSIDILPAWGCNWDRVIFIRPNLEFWTIKSNKINQNTYADASIIELYFIILASVHVLWLILFDFNNLSNKYFGSRNNLTTCAHFDSSN